MVITWSHPAVWRNQQSYFSCSLRDLTCNIVAVSFAVIGALLYGESASHPGNHGSILKVNAPRDNSTHPIFFVLSSVLETVSLVNLVAKFEVDVPGN